MCTTAPSGPPAAAVRLAFHTCRRFIVVVALGVCGCAALPLLGGLQPEHTRKITPGLLSWMRHGGRLGTRAGASHVVDVIVEIGADVEWLDARQAAMAVVLSAPDAAGLARLTRRLEDLHWDRRHGEVADVHERALLSTRIEQISRRLDRRRAAAAMVAHRRNSSLASGAASRAKSQLRRIPGVEMGTPARLYPTTVLYIRAEASSIRRVARLDTVRQVGRSHGLAP